MRWFLLFVVLAACNTSSDVDKDKNRVSDSSMLKIDYAEGFEIKKTKGGYLLNITKPWPDAQERFSYYLYYNEKEYNDFKNVDFSLKIPLQSIVVTSTTHIPSLDTLNVLDKLIGFPNTNYISTSNALRLVENGKIEDVGQNESLNTEVLLDLNPDAVVSFAVKGENKSTESLKRAGIPVLYNADWVESEPLGKAEWIKFFGVLFDKVDEASNIFKGIKKEYESVKKLAKQTTKRPSVISGALWKDQWYLPAGESWQAKLLQDANANYLYAETEGTGSLSLSFESVFTKARGAEFWIGPAQYTSYQKMIEQQEHYRNFKAFQNKNIYSFSSTLGKNGGVLYYELAPNRPDIVLKDIIHILHSDVLPGYRPFFFKPLNP